MCLHGPCSLRIIQKKKPAVTDQQLQSVSPKLLTIYMQQNHIHIYNIYIWISVSLVTHCLPLAFIPSHSLLGIKWKGLIYFVNLLFTNNFTIKGLQTDIKHHFENLRKQIKTHSLLEAMEIEINFMNIYNIMHNVTCQHPYIQAQLEMITLVNMNILHLEPGVGWTQFHIGIEDPFVSKI